MSKKLHTTYYLPPTNKRKSAAFTLVETLIYAALISMIIGMVIIVAFQIVSGSGQLSEKIFLAEESSFLLRKIGWVIGSASVINSPNSGETSNTSFSVDRFGIPAGENPITFSVTAGNLTIDRGGAGTVNLNSSLLNITNATFTHISATGTTPAGIKVELEVSGTNPSVTTSYELTAYLRQ